MNGNLPPGYREPIESGPAIPTAKCRDCRATVYAGAIQACECGCGRSACRYCMGEFEGKRLRIGCMAKAMYHSAAVKMTERKGQ